MILLVDIQINKKIIIKEPRKYDLTCVHKHSQTDHKRTKSQTKIDKVNNKLLVLATLCEMYFSFL